MSLFATGYVMYQTLIDLPMYYNRWQEDKANGRVDNELWDGVFDALRCHKVTRSSEHWSPNILWLTMYFTFAPLAGIGTDYPYDWR